jgi:hypothetical protein
MLMNEEKITKKIELIFPESDLESRPVRRGPGGDILHKFAANIDDITSWFSQYQLESIELTISGGIETQGLLKLAVSAKGEGGLKLTLKPKPN